MARKPKILGGVIATIFDGIDKDGKETFFLPQDIQLKFANRLNAIINLPAFNETQERAIFIKIVRALDKTTFRFVPKEILQVAFTGGKALPAEIVNAFAQNLPAILAAAVPLPFLPLPIKEAIITAFLSPLLTALGSGQTLGDLLKKNT